MIVEMKVPSLGESINEVTLAQWLVAEGDYVEMDQPVAEMETDKASQELYAEKAGKVEFMASEGDDLAVGELICKIDTSVEAPKPSGEKKKETAEVKEESKPVAKKEVKEAQSSTSTPDKPEKSDSEHKPDYPTGIPSPSAAKLIRENGLDASKIEGNGKDGRLTKADVLKAIKEGNATLESGYGALVRQKPAFARSEKREKLSRLRKTVAKRLVFAKNSTAMLTTFNEIDCGPMMAVRDKYKEKFKETHGVGLGFMSFFTKACALALQQFPKVNAFIDEEELIYHDYVDVSIAVSTPKGLVVPVIRNAESLSMHEIEAKVKELAIKGRDGKLTVDEMTGGTFTISNGGVFGSLMSTPIINPPQSAILGMHKIEERPVVVDGAITIKKMMYVALSYDHRIIDGKESVTFLVTVKDYLENPEKMLLGGDPVEMLLGI